jgi:PAS domain S-box-containing protein
MVHPEDRDMVAESYKSEDFPNTFSFRALRKNGESLWVEINAVRTTWEKRQATLNVIRDITERKQAEKRLRSLTSMVEQSTDSIISTDTQFRITYMNPASEKLYGCSFDEVRGETPGIFNAEPNSDELQQAIYETISAGKTYTGEWLNKRKDGSTFYCQFKISPLFDESDNIIGYMGSQSDITERKRAEEELRLFSQAAENSPDGVAMGNFEGRITYVNETFVRMFGYSKEELIGKEIASIYPKDQIPKLEDALKATMEGGWTGELVGKTKNGELYPMAISSAVVMDEKGGVIVHMASHRDITKRKQTEESLRESKEFAEGLISSMQDGLSVLNSKTEHINVNDSFCNMTGFSRDELIGVGGVPHPYWTPEEYENIQKAFEKTLQGDFEDLELRFMRKNDERFPVIISPSWLKDRKGEIISYHATVKDITERKRAEEELKRSREELRNLAAYLQSAREQERTNMAREIHDELAQALTALKMDISWLTNKLPKDQQTLLDKTKAMIKLTDMTIKTVKKISTELRPGILDDLGLVAAIEWQAEEFKNRTGITCELTIDPEDIILDQDRSTTIFRIFQETLTNVARHAKATAVTVSLKEKDSSLELRVRDSGKGITKEQISDPKSFGLMGIRERAKSWGGEVKISGRPGKGTTVVVRIPGKE